MDPQIIIMLAILSVTVVLMVTEFVRIDVVAIGAMLILAWTGIITPEEARSGFSSNAILAIMGVMIMGRGLYRTGITDKIATFISRIAGHGQRRVITTVSLTVGVMSGFMQNIGAAALFLPVLKGVSSRDEIPLSNLLMPMGFAALLGGTLTMVGTSSLIVLNDLLAGQGLSTFDLFSATPVGLALLAAGVTYFFVLGKLVFPTGTVDPSSETAGKKLLDIWDIADTIFRFRIPSESALTNLTLGDAGVGERYNVNLLSVRTRDDDEYESWKDIRFDAGQEIVVQGRREDVDAFEDAYDLRLVEKTERSEKPDDEFGYAEMVIPARSNLIGKTLRELPLRETYNAQVVLFFSESEVIEGETADRPIKAGDTLVLQGSWESLASLAESEDFIAVTPLDHPSTIPEKAWLAVLSFVGSIVLVMVTDHPISIGFLTGAAVMVLGGVMSIEDAYRSIEWKVIFLISGLIPIGIAMETSGTASLLAANLVTVVGNIHPYLILGAVGVMTTIFSLLMSNVAATVLMVPLVLQLSGIGGLTSQVLVLQVGLCAANSFVIPTHHVNALLMTPGGYRVADYLKAGTLLTLIFIVVSTTMLYFFYLGA